MTRAEISAEYELSETGRIRSPGKFEGEPAYVAALWFACFDGGCEELTIDVDGGPVWLRQIEATDRDKWPEIPASAVVIALWQSDLGFVLSKRLDENEAQRWRADAERAEAE